MQQLDQVLALKPNVITLPLREISIPAEDVPICSLKGYSVVLDKQARNNIVNMAGLSDETVDTIRRTSGTKAANQILAQAFKAMQNQQVTVALDGNRITRVVSPDSKKKALSNITVVQLTEMLVKKGMNIWGLQISPDGTGANIQILDPRIRDHATQENESVSIGRSIHWDALGGTSIHDFVQRMVCSNGATLNEDGKALRWLDANVDPATIYSTLFSNGAEKSLTKYFAAMERMQEMRMSVREWNQVKNWLSMFQKDASVIREHIGPVYFDKMGDIHGGFEGAYQKVGIDLDKLNADKQKVCQTDVNWWDMTNCLTWLASHENESNVGEWQQSKLMGIAGRNMSKKSFDSDMWMEGLPVFNNN